MDFGFGLGYSGVGGHNNRTAMRTAGEEWELAFRMESLSLEVNALVQERRALRCQLDGAYEGMRALSGAVEALAADVRHLQTTVAAAPEPPPSSARGSKRGLVRHNPPEAPAAGEWNFLSDIWGAAPPAGGNQVSAQLQRAREALQTGATFGDQLLEENVLKARHVAPPGRGGSEDYGDMHSDASLERESHELECSVWDACLFIGLGVLNHFDTMVLAMTWMVNVCVQFCFTSIIWYRFRESPFNEDLVLALRKWRAIYGHDSSLVNPATQGSLVSDVCQGSEVMTSSQSQTKLYNALREFLPNFTPDPLSNFIRENLELPDYRDSGGRDGGITSHSGHHFSGVELCIMLMVLWTLMICRELRATYETHSAVWTKARDHPYDSVIERTRHGHLVLRSVTVRRAVMMTICVTLPRVIIAGLLLVGGSYFIVSAENMQDLILNALSLEFIIHTDELLYSVIATKNVRMILEDVEPIRLGTYWNRFQSSFKILTIICIICYVSAVNFVVISPVVGHMKDAMTTMCGGDIHFIAKRYSDGVTRTVDPVEHRRNQEYSYAYCSVLQRTGLAGAESASGFLRRQPLIPEHEFKCVAITDPKLVQEAYGPRDLRNKGEMKLSETYLYAHGPCQDSDLVNNSRLRLVIQEATHDHLLGECSSAWPMCGVPPDTGFASTLVRLYCPQTCRCAGPGQFFAGSGEGCPQACVDEFEEVLARSSQCEDRTPEELRSDQEWRSYTQSVVKYLHQLGMPSTVRLARIINTTVMTFGCRALTDLPKMRGEKSWNFCDPLAMRGGFNGAEHRTIRPFCPASCECAAACGKDPTCKDCPKGCRAEAIAS